MKNNHYSPVILSRIILLATVSVLPALAGCDEIGVGMSEAARRGETIFAGQCATCHRTAAAAPPLEGIVGRPAGAVDYPYSRALREARFTWDAATLEAFLVAPHDTLPGNQMAFYGIEDRQTVADLLAYLEHISN